MWTGEDIMEKAGNLKDRAYMLIKNKIVKCEYLPNQFLVETDLMKIVGASRTPIREALNKLEQDGLITILPKRGVMVNDITLAAVNEIFEVRFLVEPYMIQTYGKLIPESIIRKQLELVNEVGHAVYSERGYVIDNELHQLFINTSGNAYLITLMDKVYSQNHRLRILSGMHQETRAQETLAEHEQVLKYMLIKDYDKAAEAMRIHLMNAKMSAIQAMMNYKSSMS
jgi:DNA-binding GntR family transcriptional regulator